MAKLAAIPAGLAFVSINIYAATEEESKAQSVKPNQVRFLLLSHAFFNNKWMYTNTSESLLYAIS